MKIFKKKQTKKHDWEGYCSLAVIVYTPERQPNEWRTSPVFPIFYLGQQQLDTKLKKLLEDNSGCHVRRVSVELGFYWDNPAGDTK